MGPVFFRNQPLGCTATIIYQMYKENKVDVTPEIAGLLCSAILSDTLVYMSPTCTETDKAAAEELAAIAGIKTQDYAMEMFAAGSDLSSKSPEEIFLSGFQKICCGRADIWRRSDNSDDWQGTHSNKRKTYTIYAKSNGSS